MQNRDLFFDLDMTRRWLKLGYSIAEIQTIKKEMQDKTQHIATREALDQLSLELKFRSLGYSDAEIQKMPIKRKL